MLDPGCSCDPYSPTRDCCNDCCMPFFGVFFVLDALMLVALVVFFIILEYSATKKSGLCRIILVSITVSCLAKVLRLGILLNPTTRHSPLILLLFFMNTHLCFGVIGFSSLLFFWARLHHDFVANKGIYGKLLPIYIFVVAFTVLFYYVQLPLEYYFSTSKMVTGVKIMSAAPAFVVAVAFAAYAFLVWRRLMQVRESGELFYKTFWSTLITAVSMIAISLEVFITRLLTTDTLHSYFFRHSFYEILYFSQFFAIPSGFIFHYIHVMRQRLPPSDSLNLRSSQTTVTNE